jgi:hypothetical protein
VSETNVVVVPENRRRFTWQLWQLYQVCWWCKHKNEFRLYVRRLQTVLLYWSVSSRSCELQVHQILPQRSHLPNCAPGEFFNKCPLRCTTASGQINRVEVKYLSVSVLKIISFLWAMRAFLSPRILRDLSCNQESYEIFPVPKNLMRSFL